MTSQPSPSEDTAASTSASNVRADELLHVINCAATSVIVVNTDGEVRYANTSAVDLLSRNEEQILGRKLGLPAVQGVTEINVLGPAGDARVAEMSAEKCTWQGREARLILLHDVTVSRELKRSNREFQEFAHSAAHDLKAPLRQIREFTHLVLQDQVSQFSPNTKTDLEYIRDAATRGGILIDRLLEYATVGGGVLQIKKMPLTKVVQSVWEDLSVVVTDTNASIEISELPEIEADEALIQRLFHNLLGNALKYQRIDVTPEIKVHGQVDEQSRHCTIHVDDNGVGFDESDAQRIFQPFVRLVTDSEFEGSGLGLATVKKIATIHSGTVTATSKPGIGSTFILTIPLKQFGSGI